MYRTCQISQTFVKNILRTKEVIRFQQQIYLRKSTIATEHKIKLSSNVLKVNPGFGQLKASGSINYIIKAACPDTYPDADHVAITCYGSENVDNKNPIKTNMQNIKTLVVTTDMDQNFCDYICEIHVPIKYNLNVELFNGANLHIEKLESDDIFVSTDSGNLTTKGLKTFNLTMNTNTGKISTPDVLQGNLYLTANDTSVSARRMQGLVMNIKSNKLKMDIKSSYVEEGNISAVDGELQLDNLHGCTDIKLQNGKLDITGLHGTLNGTLGKVQTNIQISQLDNDSNININEGDLNLSIMENPKFGIEGFASVINSDEKLDGSVSTNSSGSSYILKNDTYPTFKFVLTKGAALLKIQDWFSTLGIKI